MIHQIAPQKLHLQRYARGVAFAVSANKSADDAGVVWPTYKYRHPKNEADFLANFRCEQSPNVTSGANFESENARLKKLIAKLTKDLNAALEQKNLNATEVLEAGGTRF